MRTLYIECSMGVAGDMLTAALLELCDRDSFLSKVNAISLPNVEISAEKNTKYGILGTQMMVKVNGIEEESIDVNMREKSHDENENISHKHSHKVHRSLQNIEDIISGLSISDKVKTDAMSVYKLIAEAEGHVHGRKVSEVHFHEVGSLDAIADIVGVCILMEEIAPQKVIVSPIHVGSGHVRCAHGILPVPAPATAYILQGIPIYGGKVDGELCTPTGAALVKYFANDFGSMPVMSVDRMGYGFGKKDMSMLSCVRTFLGESL